MRYCQSVTNNVHKNPFSKPCALEGLEEYTPKSILVASLQCYGCYAEWLVLLTSRLNRCNHWHIIMLGCVTSVCVYEMKSKIRLQLGLLLTRPLSERDCQWFIESLNRKALFSVWRVGTRRISPGSVGRRSPPHRSGREGMRSKARPADEVFGRVNYTLVR